MKNLIYHYGSIGSAIVVCLLVVQGQRAMAGWTGIMNGAGVGYASVNVRSSTLVTNRVTTLNNTASPSAAMAPYTGYKTNAPLPAGAATNTYARIKGLPGGIWQASLNAANSGDGTDNAELESRVTIVPADCAAISFDTVISQSQSGFSPNGFTGTITVNAAATAGTALWLRGFEYTNAMENLPPDDPSTVQNETIEYLKTHGVVVFESLMVGPFEFGSSSNANASCPLLIPFTLASGDTNNLIFATDAAAKCNPLEITCPGNIAVTCGVPVVYQPVIYYGCGDVNVTYDPPSGSFFPVGTTPVAVTVADQNGNSTNCTFTVTVMDITRPEVPVLPILTGQSSVQVPPPTTIDVCGTTTNVITGTTTDPTSYNAQGTNVVHWQFDDGNGNISTVDQTVIVKDTVPPVTPVLSTVTGQCSATVTAPTTSDDVAGTVTGTTTDPLTYNVQGTFTVHWAFSDGNGNSTTANQTVIVKDTIPPVVPTLSILSNQCSVQVPTPTATDTCVGNVTGTTTDPTVYNTQGTYTVRWSFSDGNGNTNIATQTVIVKDTIPPVPPNLTSCSGTLCSPVTLTAPKATDNCAGLVTGTTTTVFPITRCGTTVVTWTFNDGNGNTSTATQTVTLKGLDFDGFYSPISGTGGSFNSPKLINVKCGSVVPVKFESKCGGDHYRTASPTIPKMSVEYYSSATSHRPVTGGGNFRRVSNQSEDDWHFDWDTSGLNPGVYQLIATLQDGSTQTVFVKLK